MPKPHMARAIPPPPCRSAILPWRSLRPATTTRRSIMPARRSAFWNRDSAPATSAWCRPSTFSRRHTPPKAATRKRCGLRCAPSPSAQRRAPTTRWRSTMPPPSWSARANEKRPSSITPAPSRFAGSPWHRAPCRAFPRETALTMLVLVQVSQYSPSEDREKRSAALASLAAAVALTALKIVVGIATGSLGILAEAAHSGLDLIAALMTYLAVRISTRPPDSTHLYGHGKIENLSALLETFLLLLTCGWIVIESVHRLTAHTAHLEVTFWSFAVMATSIAV